MNKTLITLAVLSISAGPAFAGNLAPAPAEPTLAPAPVFAAPVYDWKGFYGGVQLGYADVETSGAAVLEGDGATLGLRAGYDLDLGQFVVGGLVQYDTADIDLGGAATLENVLRVGLRAGVDSGRNLFYGTAGYARADTDLVGQSDGYFAGVGYEVFLTDNVTAGAELLYHDFDGFDGLAGLEAEATTFGLSVNYRY
ncbi:MAG: outer membrane beta-barrel protein [Jannaschia sp.]